MTEIAWQGIFWGSAAIFVWGYAGYPIFLNLLASKCRHTEKNTPQILSNEAPRISVVLAARNESAAIVAKIENLLRSENIPLHEIIVACDHCTDDTAALAEAFAASGVRVLRLDEGSQGKAAALNAAVAAASGDLVLFADVRQTFAPDTVARLAAWFTDPANGAVSGSLEIQRAAAGSGQGLDAYWSLEKRIRAWESKLDSAIGCTGAIYMIRRSLYEPLSNDTLLDDVVVPMRIAVRGSRVRFDPEARAFDPQELSGEREQRRKMRTLAGNFQMLFRYPGWLLPWRNRLWWQLITHKYLRIAGPVLLAACCISSVMLRHYLLYRMAIFCQLVIYGLGITGLAMHGVKKKLLSIPAAFLLLQISIIRGFLFWLKTKRLGYGGWK